jgi:hypothetical protein
MSDLPPPRDFLQSPKQDVLNLPFLGGDAGESQGASQLFWRSGDDRLESVHGG